MRVEGRNILIAILAAAMVFFVANPWGVVYWTGRVAVPAYWSYQSRDLEAISGPDYNIRYHPSITHNIGEILDAKLKYSALMEDYFGFSGAPPLVVVLEREELNRHLGEGYSLESAGAYHVGVILLGFDQSTAVESIISTLVHEMGHHYVHLQARGNYPVWYTEGVAQLMEYKFVGQLWFDGIINKDYYMYSIAELSGDYYALEDQVSAYRQALDLVLAIEQISGGQANKLILRDLGRGKSFAKAMESNIGLDPDGLYNHVYDTK